MALAILDKETDKICHPDNDFSDILKVNKIHTHVHAHADRWLLPVFYGILTFVLLYVHSTSMNWHTIWMSMKC